MPDTLTTSLGDLAVRKAQPEDLPTLIALLREAQAWMDERGLHQWVPGAHDPALVEAMIEAGTAYVVVEAKPSADATKGVAEAKRIIAMIVLRDSLPTHWSPVIEPFGYLSTLHVARDYAAHGIGSSLIHWAEAVLRERGKVWACLDCSGKNPKLCAYYQSHGYTAIGEVETYPGYTERMMHKRLGA